MTPLAQRAPSWNALLGLQDRRDGPYMEEFQVPADYGGKKQPTTSDQPGPGSTVTE